MRLLLLIIGLVYLVTSSPIENQYDIITVPIEPKADEAVYRLNEAIVPYHYDLQITPYFEDEGTGDDAVKAFTFHGLVEITIMTEESNRSGLRIHSKNLEFKSDVTICKKLDPESCLVITSTSFETDADIMIFNFQTPLDAYEFYIFKVEYLGQMDDDMHGFYRSSYTDGERLVWLGATHLEPTHARRVFPGFDEPQYKATYRLVLIIPNELDAISNTLPEGDSTAVGDDRKKIQFRLTPYMSTYLLCFIVSEFEYFENTEYPQFKVYARPDQVHLAEYASQVGPVILESLSEYFDYDYYRMINKMDMAALPDFSAGAMENWGLLTYRETNQLYDPNLTTDLTKQRIAAVITHEQVHMWFGDLVGCQWWSYLWLNEGFARYYQYHGTAWTEQNWDLESQFPVEQVQVAMILDASDTSHPMTNPDVVTQAEASAMFDNISYSKAASILRMFRFAMGDDEFRDALRSYLKDMNYKPATPDELFPHLEKYAYEGWTEDMSPWTTQAGYPVIKVEISEDRQSVSVTQKRFLLNPNESDRTRWTVPLTWVTKSESFETDVKPKHLLKTESEVITLNTTDTWVIFNVQESGFYRVDYDDATWTEISQLLHSDDGKNIHVVNRAAFIDDLMSFARAGERDYKFVLEHIEFLEHEEHYIPWLSAFNSFSFLVSRLNAEALGTFRRYLLKILPHVFENLGFAKQTTDRQIDVYNRANVINWACKALHAECIEQARILFDEYKNEGTQIDVNIRQAVYCSAIREGDMSDFEFLYQKFVDEEIATEKIIIVSALGCARDATILEAFLDKIFKTNDVRLQDKRTAFSGTYTNTEENVDVVINYVYENHEAIETSFGSRSELITSFTNLAARFTVPEQLEKYREFLFTDNSELFAENRDTLERAATSASTNLVWIEKNIDDIVEYIDDYAPASAVTNVISMTMIITIVLFNIVKNYF